MRLEDKVIVIAGAADIDLPRTGETSRLCLGFAVQTNVQNKPENLELVEKAEQIIGPINLFQKELVDLSRSVAGNY